MSCAGFASASTVYDGALGAWECPRICVGMIEQEHHAHEEPKNRTLSSRIEKLEGRDRVERSEPVGRARVLSMMLRSEV